MNAASQDAGMDVRRDARDSCRQTGGKVMTGVPRRMLVQAAAWLARLSADDKRTADEARFRAWLAKDPRCGIAFATVLEVWDIAGAGTEDECEILQFR